MPTSGSDAGRAHASRAYSGIADLRAMQDLASRTWAPGSRWHIGDLGWQREEFPDAPAQQIRLWAQPGGPVLAWGRAEPAARLDLVVDPDWADLADRVLSWFAETVPGPDATGPDATGPDATGPDATVTVTVSDHEPHLIAALARHGYQESDGGPFFTRLASSLTDLPVPALPEGYLARPAGPDDLTRRAQSHRAAWQSAWMTDDRYRAVTRTWPYRRDLDWVVEAPDASFAANCLLWLDERTASVLMEPVGRPRPAFLDLRTSPWAISDRVAWGEIPADGFARVPHLPRLAAALRPVAATSQLIHGDLGGNVLFDDQLPPAVIDFSPYWRPTAFAAAIVVADALVFEGADARILDAVGHIETFGQFLVRALIFRAATDWLLSRDDPVRPDGADLWSPAVELACQLAGRR